MKNLVESFSIIVTSIRKARLWTIPFPNIPSSPAATGGEPIASSGPGWGGNRTPRPIYRASSPTPGTGPNSYYTATITLNGVGQPGIALNFSAGTLIIQANNPGVQGRYGTLDVAGNMNWYGGTFQDYVNAATGGSQTQLDVGQLVVSSAAHLHVNELGNPQFGLTWYPVQATTITGSPTFDPSNMSFGIYRGSTPNYIYAYGGPPR